MPGSNQSESGNNLPGNSPSMGIQCAVNQNSQENPSRNPFIVTPLIWFPCKDFLISGRFVEVTVFKEHSRQSLTSENGNNQASNSPNIILIQHPQNQIPLEAFDQKCFLTLTNIISRKRVFSYSRFRESGSEQRPDTQSFVFWGSMLAKAAYKESQDSPNMEIPILDENTAI